MFKSAPIVALLAALLPATPVAANDGFGGLSATGLTFGQTEAVVMEEEDLFISLDKIAVSYVFRNVTAQDVTGEVIFPLPPIFVGDLMMSSFNLPQDANRDDLVGFTARVNGAPVAVSIDRIAVLPAPWQEDTPASAQYDTPGPDVTATLNQVGIPLSIDAEDLYARLAGAGPLPISRPRWPRHWGWPSSLDSEVRHHRPV